MSGGRGKGSWLVIGELGVHLDMRAEGGIGLSPLRKAGAQWSLKDLAGEDWIK